MSGKSKIVPCVDCQEMFPRKQLNRMGRCFRCAIAAARDAARQLHNHEGPYYERWKAAMKERIGRL